MCVVFTSLGVYYDDVPLDSPHHAGGALSLSPVKQVAFGVFPDVVFLPFLSWFLYEPFGVADRLPVTLGFIVLALILFGTRVITPRTPLSKSIPAVELFFNRLLLDRDIRDAKAWVSQKKGSK